MTLTGVWAKETVHFKPQETRRENKYFKGVLFPRCPPPKPQEINKNSLMAVTLGNIKEKTEVAWTRSRWKARGGA
jgi:hypothetical protein